MAICFFLSIPLGILLFALGKDFLIKEGFSYQILSFLFGTSFGNRASILPLSLVGISLYTRFVEQAS